MSEQDKTMPIMPEAPESVLPPHHDAVRTPDDELQGVEVRDDRSGLERMSAGEPATSDIYANQEQAKLVGEETIGGTTPTPDLNITDSNAATVGIDAPDGMPIATEDTLERRDDRRWELDPESAEDYREHDI